MLKGLLAGGITLGVAAVFPQGLVFSFLAVVLSLSLGVFPGMAMADSQDGRPALQWLVAIFLAAVAMSGLWGSPLLLAWAFFLHALWSLAHRLTVLGDGIPEGYPAFSFTFDLVLAGFSAYVSSAGLPSP